MSVPMYRTRSWRAAGEGGPTRGLGGHQFERGQLQCVESPKALAQAAAGLGADERRAALHQGSYLKVEQLGIVQDHPPYRFLQPGLGEHVGQAEAGLLRGTLIGLAADVECPLAGLDFDRLNPAGRCCAELLPQLQHDVNRREGVAAAAAIRTPPPRDSFHPGPPSWACLNDFHPPVRKVTS